jgi:hypothetical protein
MPQAAQSLRIVMAPRVNLAITCAAVDGRHQVDTMRRQQAGRWLASTNGTMATVGLLLAPPRAALRRNGGEVPITTRALAPVMEVVRRLSARAERIEGGLHNPPRSAEGLMKAEGHRGMRSVVTPVPSIVHRNAGHTASAESQPATAKRIDPKAFNSTPATAPPAIDVSHLADEVVRSIDRRITAQRERLGRG